MIIKKIQVSGNSKSIYLPKTLLDLLDIDENTNIIVKTDGKNIVLIPITQNISTDTDLDINCHIFISKEKILKAFEYIHLTEKAEIS